MECDARVLSRRLTTDSRVHRPKKPSCKQCSSSTNIAIRVSYPVQNKAIATDVQSPDYTLEDAAIENGCLAVAPGSHITHPLTQRCRVGKNGLPEFADLAKPVYASVEGLSANTAAPEKDDEGNLVYKQLEVKAGTLILMHGNLMHTSEANESGKSRVAFNFGVVEGTHEWLADNCLQPYEGETEFEQLCAC